MSCHVVCIFVCNCQRVNVNVNSVHSFITLEDRKRAIICIVRLSQLGCFTREINDLSKNKPLLKSSSIRNLNPFLDDNGIIRASTRIVNANFSFDARYPIILHVKSKFVELLISHVHMTYYHATRSFIKQYMLSRYHIVGGLTNIIKKINTKLYHMY